MSTNHNKIVILNGGPGCISGDVTDLVEKMRERFGIDIWEQPLTQDSLEGQIKELHDALLEKFEGPIILIGHSYGAMLAAVFTARHSKLVKKLLLLSSGLFEDRLASNINETRLKRWSQSQKELVNKLTAIQEQDSTSDAEKNRSFAEIGALITQADTYAPLSNYRPNVQCSSVIYKKVWPQMRALRQSGELLKMLAKIKCSVVAFHGDYDAHPYIAIKEPLSKAISDFKFILLERSGHYPWREKFACDIFLDLLKKELID